MTDKKTETPNKINITEQDYLQLASDSKRKFDELDLQKRHLIYKLNQMKKRIICSYAFARKLDDLFDEVDLPTPYKNIVEYMLQQMRTDLSFAIFDIDTETLPVEEHDIEDLELISVMIP
jgi:hypothetical protein